jgi:hypothetical protein
VIDIPFLSALPAFGNECNALALNVIASVSGVVHSTSATSVAIGTGDKAFTIGTALQFAAGLTVMVSYATTPSNWMWGIVKSYDSGTGDLVD